MKRWVVCKRYFDTESNAWEPAINRYRNNNQCWNMPGMDWMLCHVAAPDMTTINADKECIVLPDLTLDALWSTVPANMRNQFKTKLEAAGLSTTGLQTTSTIRAVLMSIGRQFQPTMDPERGDIPDLTE